MQPSEPEPPLASLRALLRAIHAFARGSIASTLAIILLAALLEGAGLVLLLPVAETLFAQETGTHSGLTGTLRAMLESWNVTSVTAQLAVMGAGFLLLVALRAAVLLKRDVLMMRLSQGFVDHTRRSFFTLLAQADWPVIKRFRKAQLLNAMTTNIARLAATMSALSRGLITVAMALAYLVAAFFVSALLGAVLLGLTAFGLVSAIIWTRRSHRLGTQLTSANRGVMQETTRFLDGMKAAKAARAEAALTQRFDARIAESRALAVEFVEQQGRLRNAVQLGASVAALLTLLVGYGLVGLSGGELLVMAAIVLRLSPNLIATFGGLQTIAHALPAFTSIRETEAALRAAQGEAERDTPVTLAHIPSPDAPLILREASVSVPGEDGGETVLVHCAQIAFAPGTLTHISGPSGAGKSTLVELVAGLHLPASGSVSRGAVELTAQTRRGWQQAVSFAPQEPFLFDDSVRANMLWPDLAVDDAAIWQVLEQCEAAELVRGLPKGLDHELLDGGARLSGGERQRLCLARALLRPASLLVLDEATSAMDPELERRIISGLRESIGQRIVLLVSHSLNAAGCADQAIRVSGGVVETARPA